MTATKPYISRRRARPGPSSEDYAERDFYLWLLVGSAMHYDLPYASAIELGARVFLTTRSTAERAYCEYGGLPTTDTTKLHYWPLEPFEHVDALVLKHMKKVRDRLKPCRSRPVPSHRRTGRRVWGST